MKNIYKNFRLLLPLIFLMQPLFTFAQSNQYLHFDKVDDFAILTEAGQFVDGAGELSITGWFYCDELSYGQGYMGFRGGSSEMYLIQLGDGKMECRLIMPSGFFEVVAPVNTIIPQVWQHWAWVYNGSVVTLYVNGFEIGSTPANGTFSDPAVPFGLGKSLLGGFNFVYGGRMDEVTIWDKGLTVDDIEDMMDNELTGTEDNLQVYYKFNQGEPGGDNTAITHLISEIGSGERDAELMNFALTGETSNFNGTLNVGYQAISFPQIDNHLTTDGPFDISADATSGLDVEFEIISGPATVDGITITLSGDAGEVIVEATQPGNASWDPAEPIQNAFMVLDPATHTPDVDARNPLAGDVYVPELGYIQLATLATITYPDLFNVQEVEFNIGGQSFEPTNWNEGYYSAWWPVPSYGAHTLTITAVNNYGYSTVETVNINVVAEVEEQEVLAVDDVWLNTSIPSVVVDAELPSYMGAYDMITATLEVTCPTGGCGEWDRVASVDARGHDGKWVEIIRYITPYGVPCAHVIDLTDYMSILQGKVSFRVNCGTLDNGYLYDLTLSYSEGTPMYNYSNIDIIWWDTYQFGDYANLQPVEDVNYSFQENAAGATLKLVSSGHGWGDLNTGNAAEFYQATHHIWVNGEETFEQHNWNVCNPNPDGCQPQNGTWYYNRAGWCPGAIAPWFDYDLTTFVEDENIDLGYVFYENYVDYCHPNHPDCVTGVTCNDCSAGFNPHFYVACNMVVFSDSPIDNGYIVSIDENYYNLGSYIELFPNPSGGQMELSFHGKASFGKAEVSLLGITGTVMDEFDWYGESKTLNYSELSQGVYFLQIKVEDKLEVRKIVIQ